MKKHIIIIFALLFNLTMWSQVVSIPDGVIFNVPNNTNLVLSGNSNLIVNSTNANFEGNVRFVSSSEQTISGNTPVEITNLYIDNNGLVLDNDLTVNSELDMQSGIINIQNNNLTIGEAASITGNFANDCMIVKGAGGVFQRNVSGNGVYFFPIGDELNTNDYSPAEVEMLSGNYTSNANINMSVENAKHPLNTSSTNYLNRYWTISANGIASPEYDVNLTYVANDVVGNESLIYGAYYTSEWNILSPIFANIISGTNISEFGDFTGGEQSAFVGIKDLSNNEINIIGLENGIKINSNLEVLRVDVFNVLGQEVYQQKDLTSKIIDFNSNVETAVYFVRVLTNKGVFADKVLIY